MDAYFKTEKLAVGYNKNILIDDINIEIEKGKIVTLIGPNGAGKSTILKSISRQIRKLGGAVYIDKNEIFSQDLKNVAKTISVMLTDKVNTDLMTCFEVTSMGRYPYTDMRGRLSEKDKKTICDALSSVGMFDFAGQDFNTLSDGQKQRVLIARALCQEPEVIILDEPTAYLDLKHKLELLDLLRKTAIQKKTTVIMSLHETDLATKISDYLVCVKGDKIWKCGSPEELLKDDIIEKLYDMEKGVYDLKLGCVELAKSSGKPRVFVVGGAGSAIGYYRILQKKQIPFASGILYDNDIDYFIAKKLSDTVISAPAFERVGEEKFSEALEVMLSCDYVLDAGCETREFNKFNKRLLEEAEKNGIPVKTEVVQ